MRKVFEDKDFNKKLFSLVIPIALQQLMLAVVSASDAVMLNLISQDKMAAVYINYKKYKWVKDLTVKEEF